MLQNKAPLRCIDFVFAPTPASTITINPLKVNILENKL